MAKFIIESDFLDIEPVEAEDFYLKGEHYYFVNRAQSLHGSDEVVAIVAAAKVDMVRRDQS